MWRRYNLHQGAGYQALPPIGLSTGFLFLSSSVRLVSLNAQCATVLSLICTRFCRRRCGSSTRRAARTRTRASLPRRGIRYNLCVLATTVFKLHADLRCSARRSLRSLSTRRVTSCCLRTRLCFRLPRPPRHRWSSRCLRRQAIPPRNGCRSIHRVSDVSRSRGSFSVSMVFQFVNACAVSVRRPFVQSALNSAFLCL